MTNPEPETPTPCDGFNVAAGPGAPILMHCPGCAERERLVAERDALREAVTLAILAIETCDDDTFGTSWGPGDESWPVKSEILAKLRAASPTPAEPAK